MPLLGLQAVFGAVGQRAMIEKEYYSKADGAESGRTPGEFLINGGELDLTGLPRPNVCPRAPGD